MLSVSPRRRSAERARLFGLSFTQVSEAMRNSLPIASSTFVKESSRREACTDERRGAEPSSPLPSRLMDFVYNFAATSVTSSAPKMSAAISKS